MRSRKLTTALFSSTALALGLGAVPAAAEVAGPYFERQASFSIYQNRPEGEEAAAETAAEIVTVSEDGNMAVYTDSPGERLGMVDISDPAAPSGAGTVNLGGEPTSVAVVGGLALVGVNTSESYTEPSGHVAVVDLASGEILETCDVGGQPDSVASNGAFLAVAIENERDEDLNDGVIPQLPAGNLAILDLGEDGRPTNCDSARIVDLTGLAEVAPEDPEPEYVDINADGVAVVTLQENNHIALVDLASGEVTGHFSAGAVDLAGIDVEEDGVINPTGSIEGLKREPDAVSWIDTERFVTANEGDYEGGSRGFTIFNTAGEVVYDSGVLMEHLAISIGMYPEERSENKGTEPEGVEVGTFGEDTLILVNSERGNFIAIFKDNGGTNAPEFMQVVPAGIAPEGVIAVPARDMFVVAAEADEEEEGFRSTLSTFTRTADTLPYPQIVSNDDEATGAPIGWGALSDLVGDPEDANTLYAVTDSFYSESAILTIDASETPARITERTVVTKDGAPVYYDLEGIAPAQGGGFWLATEGNAENETESLQRATLIKVDAEGVVEQEAFFPDAAYEHASNRGFEGVAAYEQDGVEKVVVAVQTGWKDDPEGVTKLGIYTPSEDSWSFVGYPLEAPKSERGGWVGLSSITHLGDARFALIERDNQQGDYAVIKTVTTIDLAGVEPVAYGEELPVVEKTMAIDILPAMQASGGWITDKPEGLGVTADGRVFLVTDNDGTDDATGETMFIELGTADQL
ncbi:MAG: esterase-like activity of phytase family protein [Geminicoccaceae bacterium]